MATATDVSERTCLVTYEGQAIGVVVRGDFRKRIFVSIDDVSSALGIFGPGQTERLAQRRDYWGLRRMLCVTPKDRHRYRELIRLPRVNEWLDTINLSLVTPESATKMDLAKARLAHSIDDQIRNQVTTESVIEVEAEVVREEQVPAISEPTVTLETIPFHSDELQAVKTQDGKVLVSIRRVCESLGIMFSSQLQRLKRNAWAVVFEMNTTGADGKRYRQSLLELSCLPKWLGEIDVNRVKPDVRQKLAVFQAECRDVLARHFGLMPVETTPARMAPEPPARSELELFKADFKACIEIAEMCGFTGNQALLYADKGYHNLKGTSPLRTFGMQLEAPDNEQIQNATDIGIHLGGISGQRVNKLIELAGWHVSVPDSKGIPRWILTEAGKKYGTIIDTNQKNSDGSPRQQPKWKLSVVPILRQLLERQAQPVLFPAASS